MRRLAAGARAWFRRRWSDAALSDEIRVPASERTAFAEAHFAMTRLLNNPALYASAKRFQRMHGPVSGLDFAAYVPFYASCGTQFVDDESLSPRPIRMFHGAADNYVPVAPCREYVQRLKAKGVDVALTVSTWGRRWVEPFAPPGQAARKSSLSSRS